MLVASTTILLLWLFTFFLSVRGVQQYNCVKLLEILVLCKMALCKAGLDVEGFASSCKCCCTADFKSSSYVFIALPLSSCVLLGQGYSERGLCRVCSLFPPNSFSYCSSLGSLCVDKEELTYWQKSIYLLRSDVICLP